MIRFEDFAKLFSNKLTGNGCIEIEFSVDGYSHLQSCWMGKLRNREGKEVYWFGLTPDGSSSYDFDTFETFVCSPIFDGKSLKSLWEHITILSIDGCDPEERLQAGDHFAAIP